MDADVTNDFYSAADDAIHGYGAQLLVGNGASPEVFEAIAGLVSITPGSADTADIDTTHLRSTGAHREHRAGIRNSGPFTCKGIWLPEHESQSFAGGGSGPFVSGGLPALWEGRANHNFRIKFGEGSPGPDINFRAYISQYQVGEIGIDDKVDFTVSFQPTEAYDAP